MMARSTFYEFIISENVFAYFNTKFFDDIMPQIAVRWTMEEEYIKVFAEWVPFYRKNSLKLLVYPVAASVNDVIKLSAHWRDAVKRDDILSVLLHEMIHAYLWFRDLFYRGNHGDDFIKEMLRVGDEAGLNICVNSDGGVYFKVVQNIRRCTNSECQRKAPAYGYRSNDKDDRCPDCQQAFHNPYEQEKTELDPAYDRQVYLDTNAAAVTDYLSRYLS